MFWLNLFASEYDLTAAHFQHWKKIAVLRRTKYLVLFQEGQRKFPCFATETKKLVEGKKTHTPQLSNGQSLGFVSWPVIDWSGGFDQFCCMCSLV